MAIRHTRKTQSNKDLLHHLVLFCSRDRNLTTFLSIDIYISSKNHSFVDICELWLQNFGKNLTSRLLGNELVLGQTKKNMSNVFLTVLSPRFWTLHSRVAVFPAATTTLIRVLLMNNGGSFRSIWGKVSSIQSKVFKSKPFQQVWKNIFVYKTV